MTQESTKAFEFIQLIADRAIKRGNIFKGLGEVLHFYNMLNIFLQLADENEKLKFEHKKKEDWNE